MQPAKSPPFMQTTGLEFVKFTLTGGVAAIINLGSRFALNFVMPFEAAVAVAYLLGMIVAFFLFQRAIFGNPQTPLRQRVIRFVQVNMLGLVIATTVSTLMARSILPAIGWTLRPFEVAHFIGIASPTLSSYLLHKHYTYRQPKTA